VIRRSPTRPEWWGVAAVAALAVVGGSLTPGSAAGGLPAGADKLLHGLGYAAISFFVAGARGERTLVGLLGTAVAVALLGAGVELVQPYVGRTASGADALANLLGAVVGVLAFELSRSR
jgi:VanZ family protein